MALLAGLAFLLASVANVHAHVHLCLDGQELPASAHLDDAGHPDDHFDGHLDDHLDDHLDGHLDDHLGHHLEQSGTHDDVDVDVPAEVLAKTLKVELPPLAPVAGIELQTVAALRGSPPPESRASYKPLPPPYWRPPLRGPPR